MFLQINFVCLMLRRIFFVSDQVLRINVRWLSLSKDPNLRLLSLSSTFLERKGTDGPLWIAYDIFDMLFLAKQFIGQFFLEMILTIKGSSQDESFITDIYFLEKPIEVCFWDSQCFRSFFQEHDDLIYVDSKIRNSFTCRIYSLKYSMIMRPVLMKAFGPYTSKRSQTIFTSCVYLCLRKRGEKR